MTIGVGSLVRVRPPFADMPGAEEPLPVAAIQYVNEAGEITETPTAVIQYVLDGGGALEGFAFGAEWLEEVA